MPSFQPKSDPASSRIRPILLGLACGVLCACSAAGEDPGVGTVSQPLSFTPNLPWPAGVTMTVTQGQNGSYGTHTGNLYYALDFAFWGCAGTHVLAAGDGSVTYTHEACNCEDCDCNQGWGNAIVVDHGNGDYSKYTHLQYNSIPGLSVGSQVCRGDHLGNFGSTGWSSGPHLHLQFQDGPGLNDTSVQFEGFAETNGVPPEMAQVTSSNAEGAGCGPPPSCEVTIDLGTTVIDDLTDCFHRGGTPQYWWEESSGHDGHHWYTYTTADPGPDCTATWDADVVTAADYTVEVYVPDNPDAVTQGVRYAVRHDGTTTAVEVDQSAHKGQWVSLGTYPFGVGGDQYVRIFDDTGEAYVNDDGPRLLCDAVRFVSAGGSCTDECSDGELRCGGAGWQECGDYDDDDCLDWGGGGACESGTHCEAGECVPGDPPDGGVGGSGTGGGSTGGAGGEAGALGHGLPGDEDSGCSCRLPARRPTPAGFPIALAALALGLVCRRRRGPC